MMNVFIMGKAGSGKDTAAEILRDMYGYNLITFADNIRFEYSRFFPDQNARTDRSKLINIGETYKKLYGMDVWVRLLLEDIINESDKYVITDGRHQIEYDTFVTKEKYAPIFVDCPDEMRFARLMKRDGTLQEEALKKECQDLWSANTYHLDNSGTIKELEGRIYRLLKVVGR